MPANDRVPPAFLSAALSIALTTTLCVAQDTLDQARLRAGEGREGMSGFYDLQRGRVTLTGGTGYPQDLLQLEGIDSIALHTPTSWSSKAFAATAVGADGQAWLFGGRDSAGNVTDDFYAWDPTLPGLAPVPRTSPWPPARAAAVLAVLRTTGDLVLFGGDAAAGQRGDTWLWHNGAWAQRAPAIAPSSRSYAAMAFDPGLSQLVLVGGLSGTTLALGDSWAFDGTAWTQLAGGPGARYAHMMALDEARGEVVLVGGRPSIISTSGQTWTLRAGVWQQRAALPGGYECAAGTLVYDPRRRQTVLTGGYYWSGAKRAGFGTRTFDGTTWTTLPDHGLAVFGAVLPPRSDLMACFNPARGRLTVFGGRLATSGAVTDETWEWGKDGGWQQRAPAVTPGPRRFGAMAAVGTLQYLFGGEDALGTIAPAALWRFDGQTWSIQRTNPRSPLPTPRSWPAMAYDSARNRLVVYGGLDQAGQTLGDVWEFDFAGATWVAGTGAPPTARLAPAMVYESGNGWASRIVLHGGQLPGVQMSRETWGYDGVSWSLLATNGPAVQQASMAHGLLYTALVGGGAMVNGNYVENTGSWRFDGSAWQASGYTLASQPVAFRDPEQNTFNVEALTRDGRLWGSMFFDWTPITFAFASRGDPTAGVYGPLAPPLTFDPGRRASVVVDGAALGDTWEWNGTEWTGGLPVDRLPPRTYHATCWSPGDGKLLVYGGLDTRNLIADTLGDTWLRDTTANTWLPVAGSGPPARRQPATCVDETSQCVLLFGGQDVNQNLVYGDTWCFGGAAQGWTPLAGQAPPARYASAMAWHAPSRRAVLFGGRSATSVWNDTWVYAPTTGWRALSPTRVPPGRFAHAMTYDSTRGRIVLRGGHDGTGPLADTWEFDGTDWSPVPTETEPVPGGPSAACYDAPHHRVVLVDAAGDVQQMWANVSAAGPGDSVNPLPLRYRSQPVVGDSLVLAFAQPQNLGILMLAPGPAVRTISVLPPPLGCGSQQLRLVPAMILVMNGPQVALGVPGDPALIGASIAFQGAAYTGSCWHVTDALNAVMLGR
ncbi:MAG: kelch repeat-containing protein [Planctomycetota bacterium]